MRKSRSDGDGELVKPSLLTLPINLGSLDGGATKWPGELHSKKITQVI